MKTKIGTVKNPAGKSANQHPEAHVEALADSGASGLIISMDLAKKVRMTIFEKGDATLKDASNKHMDVYGRGEIYGTGGIWDPTQDQSANLKRLRTI